MATDEAGGLAKATNGGVGAIQKIAELNGLGGQKTNIAVGRCMFVYQVLVGYVVEVKTADGATHEGVFHAMESGGLILRMARLVRDKNGVAPRSTLPESKKVIPADDWLEIKAKDVRMGGADVGPQGAGDDAGGFGTDAAISRGRGGAQGRELQRWAPDADDSQLMHLEDSMEGGAGSGWDQFALNERKFGVRTDYSEELYTTAFDPSKSKISVAEADRLAAEILKGNKSNTTNVHMLEERGIEIDDGDMDEEDRYGAVIREAPAIGAGRDGGGRYPPQQQQRASQGAWGRGAPAAPSASAPISIDARKEANKVRAQMTAAGGKASSPYGTPKQLASPLVGDAQKLAALNLDPGMPRVDAATRRDFEQFKAQQRPGGPGPSGGSGTLSEMKQFSESVGTKLQHKASPGGSAASTPSAAATHDAAKKPAGSSLSALNPNAKSFSFNVNAKSFVFAPKAGSSAPPTPPSAAAGAPPPPAVAVMSTGGGGPVAVASRPTPPPPPPTSHPQGIGGHGGPQYHHPQQQQQRQHPHRSFEGGDGGHAGEPGGPYHHGNRDRQQHQQHHRDDRGGGYERRGGDRGNGPPGGPQMAARSPPGPGMQMGPAGMHGNAMMSGPMGPMVPVMLSPHGYPQMGPRGYAQPYIMPAGPSYPGHMAYGPRGAIGGPAVMVMAPGLHAMPMAGGFPAGMAYPGPAGGRPGAHSSGGGGHNGSRGGGGDRDGGGD